MEAAYAIQRATVDATGAITQARATAAPPHIPEVPQGHATTRAPNPPSSQRVYRRDRPHGGSAAWLTPSPLATAQTQHIGSTTTIETQAQPNTIIREAERSMPEASATMAPAQTGLAMGPPISDVRVSMCGLGAPDHLGWTSVRRS